MFLEATGGNNRQLLFFEVGLWSCFWDFWLLKMGSATEKKVGQTIYRTLNSKNSRSYDHFMNQPNVFL